jgi:hypothetical protein
MVVAVPSGPNWTPPPTIPILFRSWGTLSIEAKQLRVCDMPHMNAERFRSLSASPIPVCPRNLPTSPLYLACWYNHVPASLRVARDARNVSVFPALSWNFTVIFVRMVLLNAAVFFNWYSGGWSPIWSTRSADNTLQKLQYLGGLDAFITVDET